MEAVAASASWLREAGRVAPPCGRHDVLYAQVWEDADVLLAALDVRPGQTCLSIASAGDNVLALLSRGPARVIAIDRNPAQIFCLELRMAAYASLAHAEVLELLGSRPSIRRTALYARCRPVMSSTARGFWDARPGAIARGAAAAGRFERYLERFRRWVLPLVHSREQVERLLRDATVEERTRFYDEEWNTWRWRLLFCAFFSRAVMGRLGRGHHAFAYVDGDVAAPLLGRTKRALTALNPAANPYVHWILTGCHGDVLPLALRAEHFDTIRTNLSRVEPWCVTLDGFLDAARPDAIDRCNLSDVFEYVSPADYARQLAGLARACRPGARLVYWNVLADRSRPAALAHALEPHATLAASLHRRDRAFFYRRLVIEEVVRCG
jgi:S-adenosylmethionine-diacylglycerol 3-amino-3-carboxypropyl transferase